MNPYRSILYTLLIIISIIFLFYLINLFLILTKQQRVRHFKKIYEFLEPLFYYSKRFLYYLSIVIWIICIFFPFLTFMKFIDHGSDINYLGLSIFFAIIISYIILVTLLYDKYKQKREQFTKYRDLYLHLKKEYDYDYDWIDDPNVKVSDMNLDSLSEYLAHELRKERYLKRKKIDK